MIFTNPSSGILYIILVIGLNHFVPNFIKNQIENDVTRVCILIHCAGIHNIHKLEKNMDYRKQNDFNKVNKDIQTIYNTISNRFNDASVTGTLIRQLILYYQSNQTVFQFWSSVHKHTLLLNDHVTQYIWLLPAKFTCVSCNEQTSLQKLRKTDIVTECGVITGIEVQTTCKRSNPDCVLKGKTVRFNGWINNNKSIEYFASSVNGPNRTCLFARALNRYVCKY